MHKMHGRALQQAMGRVSHSHWVSRSASTTESAASIYHIAAEVGILVHCWCLLGCTGVPRKKHELAQ
jgi:hypothetical protein